MKESISLAILCHVQDSTKKLNNVPCNFAKLFCKNWAKEIDAFFDSDFQKC